MPQTSVQSAKIDREVTQQLPRKKSNFWFRRTPSKSVILELREEQDYDNRITPKSDDEDDDDDWYTLPDCPISDHLVCPLLASISLQDEEETIARVKQKASKLYSISKVSDAEALFRLGKDIAERAYGTDHFEVVKGFCNIAKCCLKQGHYREARAKYFKAVELAQDLVNSGHTGGVELLLSAHVGLAATYLNQSKLDEAESHCNTAKALVETHYVDDAEQAVEPLEVRAALLDRRGKYNEAINLYRMALKVLEKHKGQVHRHMARILRALTNILRKQGNFYYAERYLKVAIEKLALCKCSNIMDHADLLIALADVYDDQGKYDLAGTMYERALSLRESFLGQEHPDVGYCCNAIGLNRIHRDLIGPETETYLLRSMHIFSHIPGQKRDLNLAASTGNFGLLCLKRGDTAGALVYLNQARDIEQSILGEEHPDVANTQFFIAQALSSQNDPTAKEEAMELYVKALDTYKTTYGNTHPLFKRTTQLLELLQASLPIAMGIDNAAHVRCRDAAKLNAVVSVGTGTGTGTGAVKVAAVSLEPSVQSLHSYTHNLSSLGHRDEKSSVTLKALDAAAKKGVDLGEGEGEVSGEGRGSRVHQSQSHAHRPVQSSSPSTSTSLPGLWSRLVALVKGEMPLIPRTKETHQEQQQQQQQQEKEQKQQQYSVEDNRGLGRQWYNEEDNEEEEEEHDDDDVDSDCTEDLQQQQHAPMPTLTLTATATRLPLHGVVSARPLASAETVPRPLPLPSPRAACDDGLVSQTMVLQKQQQQWEQELLWTKCGHDSSAGDEKGKVKEEEAESETVTSSIDAFASASAETSKCSSLETVL